MLMATIAARIRERRKALGLNQEELAAMLNITQSQISRYERGDNDPTADILIALSRVLHTSSDYLLGLTDDPAPQASELSPEERNAIAAWRRGDIAEAVRTIVND
jgi:transcriptional regulator with XRE-family HTH domain